MQDHPKTPAEPDPDDMLPILPDDVGEAKKSTENVKEKGEPFEGNFA